MKYCKIGIALSSLLFFIYFIFSLNSIELFPFIPDNFFYFLCLSIVSLMNLIISILAFRNHKKIALRIALVIITALSAYFFLINVPFKSRREDSTFLISKGKIVISRYTVLTDQRLMIKYVDNMLYSSILDYRIMPRCSEPIDNCLDCALNNNTVEIQYLAKDQEIFTWIYDIGKNKITEKYSERLIKN